MNFDVVVMATGVVLSDAVSVFELGAGGHELTHALHRFVICVQIVSFGAESTTCTVRDNDRSCIPTSTYDLEC